MKNLLRVLEVVSIIFNSLLTGIVLFSTWALLTNDQKKNRNLKILVFEVEIVCIKGFGADFFSN